MGWLTASDLRAPGQEWWAPLEVDDDTALDALLASARVQCEEYAPELGPDDRVPDHYLLAQAMQARAIWRSQKAGANDQIGGDLAVTVFPMDWTVRTLLRPRRRLSVR